VEQQTPFVGMAGKNLSKLIEGAGLSRERDFLITNAFPFRTFQDGANGIKNRTPSTPELKAGSLLLKMELEIVQPRMILILGGSAKKAVMKLDDKALTATLKKMENHSFQNVMTDMGFETTLGLSFHPSPLVYNMQQKRDTLIKFFHELKNLKI
jgi:DNA polymerase